jgi:preprotein translocase subunit SecG
MLAYYAVITVHVLVCFILVLVVLLQSGKGADLAGAFGGGGSQTAFGSRGPASFLSKVTTGAAVLFMITSILLSGLNSPGTSKSVMENTKGAAAPAPTAPAPASRSQGKVLTPEEIQRKVQEAEAQQKQSPAKASEQPAAPPGKQAPAAEKKTSAGKSPAW